LKRYGRSWPSHESPRTTKLYDRTGDEITLDEVVESESLSEASSF
jgi:hypothetical protein